MCRFSASLAPPPAPETDALESLLQDDSFNWFDAIDDIADDGLAQAAFQPQAQESDSTRDGSSSGPSSGSVAVGGSDTSSYDLVEMFKQQVEQQAPVPVQAPVAQGFQLPQLVAPIGVPFAALPQQQMMCGVAGPFAGACMAPAFLPAGMPGAAAPAMLNNTVGTPTAPMTGMADSTPSSSMPCNTGSGTLTSACGRRGSRSQKTQVCLMGVFSRSPLPLVLVWWVGVDAFTWQNTICNALQSAHAGPLACNC
jgi:hypothetical protein